jgi:hypothetical protein
MKSTPAAVRLVAVFASAAITWSLLSGVYALAQHPTLDMPIAQGMPSDVVVVRG